MCHADERKVKPAKELMDLKELRDELQAEIDRVTDRIKAYMWDLRDQLPHRAFPPRRYGFPQA